MFPVCGALGDYQEAWYQKETWSGSHEIQNSLSLTEGIELCKLLVPNFCWAIVTAQSKKYSLGNILLSFPWQLLF